MVRLCGKKYAVRETERNVKHSFFLNSFTNSRHKENAVMVSVFSKRKVAEMTRIIQM
jgi:hypothetical protein